MEALNYVMVEDEEEPMATRRRGGDKTGPIRLAGDADPAEFDDEREPENTRDMLNMHLKRTNITLDKNFERMERAIGKLTDTYDDQDQRHAETLLKLADRQAQAQVDVATKTAESRKYDARVNGVLVAALIFGVLALAGLNIKAKYGDGTITTSAEQRP